MLFPFLLTQQQQVDLERADTLHKLVDLLEGAVQYGGTFRCLATWLLLQVWYHMAVTCRKGIPDKVD